MLILKAVGAVAVISSAIFWSSAQKSKDSARLKRLESQITFVRFIRDKIDRYLAPITEIMRDCDEEILQGVCIGCADSACVDVQALQILLKSGTYYPDGGEIMDSFLLGLGTSYREGEIAGCDVCIRGLCEVYERLKKDLPRERKGRTVLALCLAAGIVIILI